MRELVGSPDREITCLEEERSPWSPAFNLDDTPYLIHTTNVDFDLFANPSMLMASSMRSPEKRSAKRPRLDRSRSANILADITNSSDRKITSAPKLSFTPSLVPTFYDSPIKALGILDSPSTSYGTESLNKLTSPSFNLGAFEFPQEEDFFGVEFLSEEIGDFSGVDIMQGFQKIGSGTPSSRSTPKVNNSSRPTLDAVSPRGFRNALCTGFVDIYSYGMRTELLVFDLSVDV